MTDYALARAIRRAADDADLELHLADGSVLTGKATVDEHSVVTVTVAGGKRWTTSAASVLAVSVPA